MYEISPTDEGTDPEPRMQIVTLLDEAPAEQVIVVDPAEDESTLRLSLPVPSPLLMVQHSGNSLSDNAG